MNIETHYRHVNIHKYEVNDRDLLRASVDELTARGCAELLEEDELKACLLYTSPSPRDLSTSRMPSSA